LIYAAGRYRAYRAASPQWLLDAAEGVGVAAIVAVGIAALLTGGLFLENVVDLGTKGTLASSGTIAILNLATGLAVTAAVVLLCHEFIEELMYPE
jgi:multicomponent Na+:H+ antiporter subunit B